jgi:SAM-dependent methyltransferase
MALEAWMPRLVAVWRRLRGRSGEAAPADRLTPDERRDVLAGVEALTAGLTRERDLAGERYLDDPRLLGAYLLLYWPVSYAQAASVLGELAGPPGEVLDVGAGPAPLALAALDAGATGATAIDRSRAALAAGEALAHEAGLALATKTWDPTQSPPAGPFDTILAGHLLNELDGRTADTLAAQLLERLRPGGRLVLIEPALRETSRALLGVRDHLVARGAAVEAPCFFRGPCPALERPGDWCHAERDFAAPSLVAELAAEARLHRDALKMTYLILRAPGAAWPEPPGGRVFRIVSEPLDEKGKLRRIGCGPEGRLPLVLPHKHVSETNEVFAELQRGDVVRVGEASVRGDGLRLERGAAVERLARAGEPVGKK